MRYFMKQKVFSWKDKFTIKDEAGNDCYFVEGEVFSLGHKLHVFDKNAEEVAFIHQKVFSFRPKFFINILNNPEIELVQKFTFFKQEYFIEDSNLLLEGNFSAHNFALLDGSSVKMQVTKEWFSWGDSYVLDIADDNDALLCICIMLAVDCANHDSDSTAASASV